MRGFRLPRPSDDGAPRRSLREDAEAEAAAELRRVLEGAGLPPEGALEVLERTAARRTGGNEAAAREPAPTAPAADEPVEDRPGAADEPVRDEPGAAGAGVRSTTRRVRKSPPGAVPPGADRGGGASPPGAAAPRPSRSGRR